MKSLIPFPYALALVLVFTTSSAVADVYDRCTLVDENTVIVKLKGGVSIKLVREGQDVFIQLKSDDDGRWLSSVQDRNAFRMIMKFIKMGRFSGCRKRLFSQKKQPVIKKPGMPGKLFRKYHIFP